MWHGTSWFTGGQNQGVVTWNRQWSAAVCITPTRRIWWRWAGFWRRCCPLCRAARPGSAGLRWCRRMRGYNAVEAESGRVKWMFFTHINLMSTSSFPMKWAVLNRTEQHRISLMQQIRCFFVFFFFKFTNIFATLESWSNSDRRDNEETWAGWHATKVPSQNQSGSVAQTQ